MQLWSGDTINVGDLVRVITDDPVHQWGMARQFDVGKVTHIDHDDNDLRIDFPNHKYWHGLISEVELVTKQDEEGTEKQEDFLVITQLFNTVSSSNKQIR